jgi:hypothetical protein
MKTVLNEVYNSNISVIFFSNTVMELSGESLIFAPRNPGPRGAPLRE